MFERDKRVVYTVPYGYSALGDILSVPIVIFFFLLRLFLRLPKSVKISIFILLGVAYASLEVHMRVNREASKITMPILKEYIEENQQFPPLDEFKITVRDAREEVWNDFYKKHGLSWFIKPQPKNP